MQQKSDKKNKFGEKLAYYLKVKGWSQQKIANELGTTQQRISRWINGDREPRFDDLISVCRILNEDPNEMLGYNDIRDE